MSFKLPELTYAYDALEPHIDATTMEIHHKYKHHKNKGLFPPFIFANHFWVKQSLPKLINTITMRKPPLPTLSHWLEHQHSQVNGQINA